MAENFYIIDLTQDKNAKIVCREKGNFGVAVYYITTTSSVCVYNTQENAIKGNGSSGVMFKMRKNVAATVLSYSKDADTMCVKIKCGTKSGWVKLGKRKVSTYGNYGIETVAYGSALGFPTAQTIGRSNYPKTNGTASCKFLNNGSSLNNDAIISGSLNDEELEDSKEDGVSDDIVTATDASLSSSDGTNSGEEEIDVTFEFQLTNVGTFFYNIGDFLLGGSTGRARTITNEDGDVVGYDIGANAALQKYLSGVSNAGGFDYGYNYRTLFGAPYQFLPTTDCRLSRSGFVNDGENSLRQAGYEFANKIIAKMPILYITPGNTSFMGSSSKEARSKLLTSLHTALGEETNSSLSAMLDDYTGKLYTINPAYAEYFNYVNPMCRAGAIFLGIDNELLYGIPTSEYHWGVNQGQTYQLAKSQEEVLGEVEAEQQAEEDAVETTTEENEGEDANTEPEVEEYSYEMEEQTYESWETNKEKTKGNLSNYLSALYYSNAIAFYINSEYSFQETFTNETTDSLLATTINSLSDRAREVQFLLGTASQAVGEAFDKVDGTLSAIKEQINSIVDKVAGGNSIFTTIANSVKTIVSGGRMQFPQIWANSTFSKSYNITIKFVTPNPDPFSWWLDCYVPMCHCMALVMPRSEYVNSYTTPFLVKAFYKGMFNIDMGIITEMSFNRGKEGSWTKDGLPTVVEVSMTIQDLYSSMGMTSIGKMFKGLTMQNVAEMDYIANLCGININEPDVFRMVKFWAAFNLTNRIHDFIPNLKLSIGNAIKTSVVNALNDLWM